MEQPLLLLVLDLTGTFAFALNGALTAVRAVRVDIVGVIALGMVTAMGGGIIRDVMLVQPPATFQDWRYLAVAAVGALIAFAFGHNMSRLSTPIEVLDAVGLSFFAVTGAMKAVDFGLGPVQAIILGTITAVGGGTIRDALLGRVPSVLRDGLYAVPAFIGAGIAVLSSLFGLYGAVAAVIAAAVCFFIRVLGLRFGWNAPVPRAWKRRDPPATRR
ncbi:trimeric intracellular cation channel family protein [Microbacterium sp. MPKO10]|uniref:trimeric intracellular cation channel family protein n=1 Tax=Microbacterium sp. MPKO10 TaxID=2989818 RepID=UPI002235C5B3|nr:trimeric intracellular cation channel family protein [Microbacterium sp. MPKO10]MCW4458961.1 trimeric intracellular cation channel family protein [Microbacterium sp. MPKO10]